MAAPASAHAFASTPVSSYGAPTPAFASTPAFALFWASASAPAFAFAFFGTP